MKRKFLVLLSMVLILTLVCASCGKKDEKNECEHTYGEKWSSNATEHWHAANCEHTDLKSDVAAHTDADQNGKCDVCNYEIGHVHTFADTWTTDETHHWKLATCSHTDEKGEFAAHTDSDENGSCDVCSAHVHKVNIYGICPLCNKKVADVDPSDFGTIIPIIVAKSDKIASGKLVYDTHISTNDTGKDNAPIVLEIISNQTIDYVFGASSAYYKLDAYTKSEEYDSFEQIVKEYEASDVQEAWYEKLADDSVFGVYTTSNSEGFFMDSYDAEYGANKFVGWYVPVSNLTDAYGPENLISTLYALSKSEAASDFTSDISDRTYNFSFNYLRITTDTAEGDGDFVDYYELEVSFTVTEFGVLTSLDVKCDCYTNSTDELNWDYTYNQADKTITMNDGALADTYTYSYTQVEGKRTYVNEHPKSSFIPTDFDIFTDEECTEKVGESISCTVDEYFYLYLGNFAPVNASVSFVDNFDATATSTKVECYANGITANVGVIVKSAGTYTIMITAADITKTITITATAAKVDSGEQGDNTVAVFIEDNYCFNVNYGEFTAPKDGDYTFTIAPGLDLGAWGEGEAEPWADCYAIDPATGESRLGGSITVSLKKGETYTFSIFAIEKNITVYIPYTVSEYTGSNTPGGDKVEATTSVVDGQNQVVFSDAEISNGSAERTLTVSLTGNYTFKGDLFIASIVDSNGKTIAQSNYKYALVAGERYTVTFGMFSIFGTSANSPISLNIVGTELQSGSGSGNAVTITEGTYTGSNSNSALTIVIEGTTVTFNYNHTMNGSYTMTYTYTVTTSGSVALYDEDGNSVHPLAGMLVIDANGNPTSASYDGNDYTLSAN